MAVIILAVAGEGTATAELGRLSALLAALIAAWLAVDPHTPDLAAQVYRVSLFREVGFAVWDDNWYAGHALLGYSLLYPPLAAALGIRLLGALCVIASSLLFRALVRPHYGAGAHWAVAWFAVGALGDVWIGRLTFALGVSLALAAALAFARGRRGWCVALGVLCAAASPVAAALLGLAALTLSLARRSPGALLALAVPGAALVLALAALFPEGGYEPYPFLSFAATLGVVLAFAVALPPEALLARLGALVYLLACLACLLVHTPIGSNVERYGVLLAGPLLLCELLGSGPDAQRRRRLRRRGRGRPAGARPRFAGLSPLAGVALCAIGVWVVWGPVRETLAVSGQATSAAYYAPVERFVAGVQARVGPVRVEVPLTRSHWEAALLAPSVQLARGWDKQMETRYEHVLLSHDLTAVAYEGWLHEQAVAYVALPDLPLDPSSAAEGRLIRAGLPYLREVFAGAHWRIYRVLGATPLASGPGRLRALTHDSFTLAAASPGRFLVRVHFTRYWTLARGGGCVARAPGGWTEVRLARAGTARVDTRFSLAAAFGSGAGCARGAGRSSGASAYRLVSPVRYTSAPSLITGSKAPVAFSKRTRPVEMPRP
jgi:hypothetical protein